MHNGITLVPIVIVIGGMFGRKAGFTTAFVSITMLLLTSGSYHKRDLDRWS